MTDSIQKKFSGKSALITGGVRNVGLSVARELAMEGASVAIADICDDLETIPYKLSSKNDMEAALDSLAAFGGDTLGLVCDVREKDQVSNAVRRVVETFGQLDYLVNNAGVMSLFPIEELSEKAWNEVLDVCLKGTYLCCKSAVPHMVGRQCGKIVNISSLAGQRGLGHSIHYCAAKHGVIGLTKALAMEVSASGINVNAVCPGTVETAIIEGLASQIQLESDAYDHFSQGHLFKDRKITSDDIAHTVCWLLSEESRSITGTVINVDAGWSARG
ncbi:MAG: SDR family oxidoreductase [Proteobacteria bacterium]|nr:SDR family oxidoreductase [Pseudomonadota bacterium]